MLWKIFKDACVGSLTEFWWATGSCSLIALFLWAVAGSTGLFIAAVIAVVIFGMGFFSIGLGVLVVWVSVKLGFAEYRNEIKG